MWERRNILTRVWVGVVLDLAQERIDVLSNSEESASGITDQTPFQVADTVPEFSKD
jgi:hypothetical protein